MLSKTICYLILLAIVLYLAIRLFKGLRESSIGLKRIKDKLPAEPSIKVGKKGLIKSIKAQSGSAMVAIGRKKLLQFNKNDILLWSKNYDERYKGSDDEATEIKLKKLLENQRYLNKPDFIELCNWKSRRPKKYFESNDAELIRFTTKYSFSINNDETRIKELMKLKGVSWPVASAILHFAFPDKYSILDFRAIWSLGWEKPTAYNFLYWESYCNKILEISTKVDLPIRTIDKALWEYSKQNQPSKCKKG